MDEDVLLTDDVELPVRAQPSNIKTKLNATNIIKTKCLVMDGLYESGKRASIVLMPEASYLLFHNNLWTTEGARPPPNA